MKIIAKDRDGNVTEIEGRDGWTIMEMLRDAGLDITAECGGACACATCHVYIDGDWYAKLPPRSEGETDMLDMALAVQPHSRLACQLIVSEELDGIEVTLAPG
jgi:2Fe-2S ferredoxin